MSTPVAPRPGPPRPGGRSSSAPASVVADLDAGPAARLRDLPVAQHADVLAEEHDRLHRLLATIDQL